jgi:hypothetical protein
MINFIKVSFWTFCTLFFSLSNFINFWNLNLAHNIRTLFSQLRQENYQCVLQNKSNVLNFLVDILLQLKQARNRRKKEVIIRFFPD